MYVCMCVRACVREREREREKERDVNARAHTGGRRESESIAMCV